MISSFRVAVGKIFKAFVFDLHKTDIRADGDCHVSFFVQEEDIVDQGNFFVFGIAERIVKTCHAVESENVVVDIGNNADIGADTVTHIFKSLGSGPGEKNRIVGKLIIDHKGFAVVASDIGAHHAVADKNVVDNFDCSGKVSDIQSIVGTVEEQAVLNNQHAVGIRMQQIAVDGGQRRFAFGRRNRQHTVSKTGGLAFAGVVVVGKSLIKDEAVNGNTLIFAELSGLNGHGAENRLGHILLICRTQKCLIFDRIARREV